MTSMNTSIATDSKFRSMLKPSKLLWRNNKTTPMVTPTTINNDKQTRAVIEEEEVKKETTAQGDYDHRNHSNNNNNKLFLSTPTIGSFHLKIKHPKKFSETLTNEIYELSTVDEAGSYITPDINSSSNKYDHDLIGDNDFQFFVPSHDCLTRSSGQHSFFTPSSTLMVSV